MYGWMHPCIWTFIFIYIYICSNHVEITLEITLKSLSWSLFQENVLWKQFCFIFATKIILKSLWTSLWNHDFASFLKENVLWKQFCSIFETKIILKSLWTSLVKCLSGIYPESLWNHFEIRKIKELPSDSGYLSMS